MDTSEAKLGRYSVFLFVGVNVSGDIGLIGLSGVSHVSFNDRQVFEMEHRRTRVFYILVNVQ